MMAPAAMPPTMPAPIAQPTQRASAVPGAATERSARALALATTVRNLVMVLVPRFEFQHHNAPRAQSFQGWDTDGARERAGSAAKSRRINAPAALPVGDRSGHQPR